MKDTKFYRLGLFIYQYRWPIIWFWLIITLACLPFLPHIVTPFKSTGFSDEKSQSAKTEAYIDKKLGYAQSNKFIIIYSSKTLLATDPLYVRKIKKSLKKMADFPIKTEIIYPSDNKSQIAKDKHSAYAVVIVKSKTPLDSNLLNKFKKHIIKPKNMTVQLGGEPLFIENVNSQTQNDLYKADFIATPISLITLLLVFGSVFAAFLPLVLGGCSALIILTTLYFLGHLYDLSVFTLNIALLLGLCLCLDYSLFIISRFRDELTQGKEIKEAIANTEATAGKAIVFSGLAVFASLSALFLFPINILFSMAVGGLTAVFVAVLMAFILLPAILSVLKNKINLLPIHVLPKTSKKQSFWRWFAKKIVKRPLFYFFASIIILLLLGYPFLSANFGVSDFHIFPKNSPNRHFFDTFSNKFDGKKLNPIVLLVKTKDQDILSKNNLANLYDIAHQLKENPLIKKVQGIIDPDSKITKQEYYSLYHLHKNVLSPGIKKLLATTTQHYFTLITIISKYQLNSPQTKTLVEELDQYPGKKGMALELTGTPVKNIQLLDKIKELLPFAILWIMLFSYLILLILLHSIFLPLKAILMNILSLSACYGALVLVFQDGYFHQWLNFEPQGMLDISLLVIIFCALFGFSMDYEVFLLSRIKETYDDCGDNTKSVICGIEKSSRIITSAAIIVICICFSFLVADILIVKAFGLGIAVAIFVDAFLIRTFLVPATMVLLKKLNWYIPRWLERILPRL